MSQCTALLGRIQPNIATIGLSIVDDLWSQFTLYILCIFKNKLRLPSSCCCYPILELQNRLQKFLLRHGNQCLYSPTRLHSVSGMVQTLHTALWRVADNFTANNVTASIFLCSVVHRWQKTVTGGTSKLRCYVVTGGGNNISSYTRNAPF
jgi:hypothetical protein